MRENHHGWPLLFDLEKDFSENIMLFLILLSSQAGLGLPRESPLGQAGSDTKGVQPRTRSLLSPPRGGGDKEQEWSAAAFPFFSFFCDCGSLH